MGGRRRRGELGSSPWCGCCVMDGTQVRVGFAGRIGMAHDLLIASQCDRLLSDVCAHTMCSSPHLIGCCGRYEQVRPKFVVRELGEGWYKACVVMPSKANVPHIVGPEAQSGC